MVATTANYAFPYPQSTDPPAGHTQMQNLAVAVDTALDTVDDRLDALGLDSGWVTAGFVAGTDFTVGADCRARKIGNLVYLHLNMTRINSIKSAPASGDMGNEVMVTVPAGYRPSYSTAISFVAATRTNGGGVLATGGSVTLGSMNSDSTIQIGDTILADVVFMV